jgi:Holliday junction DNA helicase RuvA
VIAHLRGRLLEKQPNRIVIDTHGVGYDVSVPLSTFYGLGDPGSEIATSARTRCCCTVSPRGSSRTFSNG